MKCDNTISCELQNRRCEFDSYCPWEKESLVDMRSTRFFCTWNLEGCGLFL